MTNSFLFDLNTLDTISFHRKFRLLDSPTLPFSIEEAGLLQEEVSCYQLIVAFGTAESSFRV